MKRLSPADVAWLARQRVSVATILKAELLAATLAGQDGGSFQVDMVDPSLLVPATDELDREGFCVRTAAGQVEVAIIAFD